MSVSSSTKRNLTTKDVLLWYPNIVGYLRILCMVASFYYAKTDWMISITFYVISFVGDVVDGFVARAFNQCSKFGGILDMVTDRVATCGLLVILSNLYQDYSFYFILLITLDISSHWFHVMSVTAHHKSEAALEHRSPILQWYYSIYPLFAYCCVGTETFYILLYVLHFWQHPIIEQVCFSVCLLACILKQAVNVVQLLSAADAIAEWELQTSPKDN
jgi:CDP-diacylglycerol--inositol 3-phosphatidyltransferase